MEYRDATALDIEAVSALHAESWRRHYRDAFSDAYLDGDVVADRLVVWTERLAEPRPEYGTIVAEDDGAVIGFVHVILEDDAQWGALVDNLHVAYARKRDGVGTRLMAEAAALVLVRTPSTGLYLWVLEQNTAAQAFYEARGGRCVEREMHEATGGGTVVGLRYVWASPAALLVSRDEV
jgi:ribosomal protein S18 acetylase RimI-like enzyme